MSNRSNPKWLLRSLCVLLTYCLVAPRANAQQNIVHNGSFESGFTLSPWTTSGTGLFAGFEGAADGLNFADIGGFLYQDLATTPGLTYHLRFAMAGNINWPGLITMETLWGNTIAAETTWNPAGHSINNLGWIYTDIDLAADSSLTRLTFENPGASNQQPFLDAVSVVVVPEPSAMSLLAGLFLCMGATRAAARGRNQPNGR